MRFVEDGGTLIQDYSMNNPVPYTSLFSDRVDDSATIGKSYITVNDSLVHRGISYEVKAKTEALKPKDGDRVLAVYEDGKPAIISFRLGKGNVVRFGSMIGIDYGGWQPGVFEYKEPRFLTYINHNKDLRKLADTIVRRSGVIPPAETDNPDVEAAVMQKGGELKLLIINHRDEKVTAKIKVPVGGSGYSVIDVRAEVALSAEVINGYLCFEIELSRLDGREIRIVPVT